MPAVRPTRAEELQGDRETETDRVDRHVQRQVHGGENQRQRDYEAPLLPGERGEPRAYRAQQHRAGDPLADRDHSGRAEHGKRERGGSGADLIGDRAAGHQPYPGELITPPGTNLVSACRPRASLPRASFPRASFPHASRNGALPNRDAHGTSMDQIRAYEKCMRSSSYTLWLWISS